MSFRIIKYLVPVLCTEFFMLKYYCTYTCLLKKDLYIPDSVAELFTIVKL